MLLLVAFATPALLWGGVSLECPSELGKVSGNKGIAVKMIVHNLSILSTRVEIPNCHCTSTGTNSTTLGPLASETVEINLATHKFPRGRGSFPLAVGYYLRGAEKMASRTVHYEVVRS